MRFEMFQTHPKMLQSQSSVFVLNMNITKMIKCDNIDCEIEWFNYPAPYSAGYRKATGSARVVRSRTTSNRLYSGS